MKSLLIVTEIFDASGLETSIRREIAALTRAGYRIHLATGPRFNRTLLPKEVATVTNNLALGPDAGIAEFIDAVDTLRHIIRDNAIDCVHAHPFTSLLPALIAAEQERIQFALTLHGPASLAVCYGPIYDFILTSAILPSAGLVVAASEETAKLASPYLSNRKALILPNGMEFNIHKKASTNFSESSLWQCFLDNLEKTKPQTPTLLSAIYQALLVSGANETAPLLQSENVLRHLGELIHDEKYSTPSLIANFQHYHDRFLELKPHHKNTQTGKKISSLDQFARQFHSELATIDQAVLDRDKHITEIAQAIAEKKNVHVGKLASIANQRQHESSALLKQLEQIRQQRSWQFTRSLTVIARGFMCSLWGAGRKICRHVRRWLAPWFVV